MGIDNKNIKITHQLLKTIGELEYFNGQWPILKKKIENELGKIKHISTIASIGSSTRIEGVQMSDEEIDNFINNIEEDSFLSRDEQEILGYKNVLDEIFDNFDVIKISVNFIKQLHKILLEDSIKDEFHRGNYKKLDNNVVAKKNGKQLGVIVYTSTPFETPFEMSDLVRWFNEESDVHSLIKCGVFIVHFLSIHPFQDGNGRLSRALTTLILLKYGYSYVPYSSLESIIEVNKKEYYKALKDTQKTLKKGPVNYLPWLDFFISCLKKQQELLDKNKDYVAINLTQSQKKILDFAESVSSFQNNQVSVHLRMNKNTVKDNLAKLVRYNLLEKIGAGKGTWYRQKLY